MTRPLALVFGFGLLALPLAAAPVPPAPKAEDGVSAAVAKLLEHRKVQKELKLSAEQRLVILDGLADIDDDHADKLNELSRQPNAAVEDYDKLDKARQKQADKLLGDAAAKTLTAAQRSRLRQLDCHIRGVAALADPQVEKGLQLTDAQKKRVKEAVERVKKEVGQYIDGAGDDDAPKRKIDLFSFRAARLKDATAALTADQKAAWERMLGPAPTGFNPDELWLKIEEELDSAAPPE
jgi:hypothetical protein